MKTGILAAVAVAAAVASTAAARSAVAQTPPAAGAPAASAEAKEPPPEFTKVCVKCHTTDKVVEGRRYREQWDLVLEQMVARGAVATDAELDVIADYLVTHFGRVAINTAPADEIAQVLHLEQAAADAIVARRKTGPIADFDALAAVPGVPVAELQKRRDAIVF